MKKKITIHYTLFGEQNSYSTITNDESISIEAYKLSLLQMAVEPLIGRGDNDGVNVLTPFDEPVLTGDQATCRYSTGVINCKA